MSRMIQVRPVPDRLHRRLTARAAAAGMTLSDDLRMALKQVARPLTPDEVTERRATFEPVTLDESPADAVRIVPPPKSSKHQERTVPRLALALALTLTLLVPAVQAQTPPDLSGTWVLQTAQSDFGPMPAPEQRTDVILHHNPHLTIQRTTVAQGQETKAALTYAVDGEPYSNDAGGIALVSRLHWEGDTLVMITAASSPQGELTITDRYTLSEDGRTLTQLRTLSIQGQELSQRLVLARQ